MTTRPPCSVDGCERPSSAKTLCTLHYNRVRTTGSVGPALPILTRPGGAQCQVDDCETAARTQSLCPKHYARLRRHGTADLLPSAPPPPKPCSVPRCPENADRRGMCHCHYQRFMKHGDASITLAGRDVSLKPRAEALCGYCGASLAGRRRNAIYCSKICQALSSSRQREVRNPQRKKDRKRRILAAGAALVTLNDWERLKRRFNHRCAYCHRARVLHMDHVVPVARGGRHAIGNLLPACKSCNSSKRDRLLSEWRLKPGGGECNPFIL